MTIMMSPLGTALLVPCPSFLQILGERQRSEPGLLFLGSRQCPCSQTWMALFEFPESCLRFWGWHRRHHVKDLTKSQETHTCCNNRFFSPRLSKVEGIFNNKWRAKESCHNLWRGPSWSTCWRRPGDIFLSFCPRNLQAVYQSLPQCCTSPGFWDSPWKTHICPKKNFRS